MHSEERALDILEQPSRTTQADILDSLAANIALLDADGLIVAVNRSWRSAADADGLALVDHGVGSNYLHICDRVRLEDAAPASRAAAGIRSVLRGEVDVFSMEYVMEVAARDAWFLMTVTPVGKPRPTGATVMHLDITARKRDESTLWRFASAMDSMADGVFIIDCATMGIAYANDAACKLHDLSREKLLAANPWEIMGTSRAALQQEYDRIIAQGGIAEPVDVLWHRADGTDMWIEVRRHAHSLDGSVSMVVLVRDITARREADSRIVYLNRVYAILSGVNTLIVRAADRDELFRDACRIPVEKGGFPACWIGILDRNTRRIHPVSSAGMDEVYREAVTVKLAHTSPEDLATSYVMTAVRERRVVVCNDSSGNARVLAGEHHPKHGIRSFAILPLIVADEVVGVFFLYARETDFFHADELRLLAELAGDVSFGIDHIEKKERLDYLAYYDALTELPNRHLFLDRLAQFLNGADSAGEKLALCTVDVARFRNINDSLGRPAGDLLLRQIAQWLAGYLGETTLLGRIDSDHFAVIIRGVNSEEQAARGVEALINAFAAHPFQLNEIGYRMAIKIGAAIFPDDGDNAESLFRHAGAALTKAKGGGDPYLFYARKMTATVAGRLGLENQLRQALEREEFVLHYQPKMSLASGAMVGTEALLRWNDPRIGLVPPARFIPILEETGLILDVGRWVLQQAVGDYLRWQRAGHRVVRIAVNVSPLQLRHTGFVDEIRRFAAIDEGVAAGLELEITESLIMEDVKLSVAALQVIRELGITIAIDDFGTGYSSLNYLAKLPIDTLKIDQSFISDPAAGHAGVTLVSSIINLAHSLNLKVVAEGVETRQQARTLKRLACDEAQGYWFSKPIPAAGLAKTYLQRAS